MDDRRRCTAKSTRSQERCKKAAILGGTVCRAHGGAAPQVKLAAAERLKELQHPAITALEHALGADRPGFTTKDGTFYEGGPDHTIRSRTSFGILDRTGLGPHSTVNVEGSLGERLARLDAESSD